MIYLIDDNQSDQRLNFYGIDYIENGEYSDFLVSLERIKKKDSMVDISHIEFLKEAKCIFLHDTTEDVDENNKHITGSRTNSLKIKELISNEGQNIPLVVFSNRMDEIADYDREKNPNYIREIKKNKFYERLKDFLEHYKKYAEIELRIIAYGKNFQAYEIDRISLRLLNCLITKKEDNLLTLTDIKIQDLADFIQLSDPNLNWKEILFNIEDKPLTIRDFRIKINKITESIMAYGTHNYNW